jgi:hypothetical protein
VSRIKSLLNPNPGAGGGSGTVNSVSATDSTITVGGTSTDPTVGVNAIPESKVTNLSGDLNALQQRLAMQLVLDS